MHVLIAPGSYKSTIKSIEATDIIRSTVEQIIPSAIVEGLVLADGGEGTLEMFGVHFDAVFKRHQVCGPLGRRVRANLCFLADGTAIIESSQAVGFSLVDPAEMNPFAASSYGVGELIRYAVLKGATKLMISMGDSATMDMGVGMLHALGVRFFANSGELMNPGLHNLDQIVDFDDSELDCLREKIFIGLVDTNDYLCGKIGQVQLYGAQKGLKDSDNPKVESSFARFSEKIERRFGVDVTRVIRSSGSGGLAAALHAFLNAKLHNTLEFLSSQLGFDERMRAADIVITGEGCLDNQTMLGKVPYFVASRSARCIALVGRYTQAGIRDMRRACASFSIFCMNPDSATKRPQRALRDLASSVCMLLGEKHGA